jgi:hypothetical protein
MKARIVLLALVVLLTTGGWDCFNSDIGVPVDVAFTTSHSINPGNNLTYNSTKIIYNPIDSVDQDFQDKLASGRLYDVQVRTVGTFPGSVSGTASVNGILLVTYAGTWAQFSTWQSLLGKSPYITPNTAGMNEATRILKNLSTISQVTVSSSGAVSGATSVPAGLSVEFRILGQADAIVN